jgi:hypothetical protein
MGVYWIYLYGFVSGTVCGLRERGAPIVTRVTTKTRVSFFVERGSGFAVRPDQMKYGEKRPRGFPSGNGRCDGRRATGDGRTGQTGKRANRGTGEQAMGDKRRRVTLLFAQWNWHAQVIFGSISLDPYPYPPRLGEMGSRSVEHGN